MTSARLVLQKFLRKSSSFACSASCSALRRTYSGSASRRRISSSAVIYLSRFGIFKRSSARAVVGDRKMDTNRTGTVCSLGQIPTGEGFRGANVITVSPTAPAISVRIALGPLATLPITPFCGSFKVCQMQLPHPCWSSLTPRTDQFWTSHARPNVRSRCPGSFPPIPEAERARVVLAQTSYALRERSAPVRLVKDSTT